MKHFLPLLALSIGAAVCTVSADELVKSAQTELKAQGFFYGEADGLNSAETAAAVRRFQIRNGLEVSGKLNQETINSLGVGATAQPPPIASRTVPARPVAPPPPAQARPLTPKPPVDLRRNEPATVQESDRSFLRQEPLRPARPTDPAILEPPAPLGEPTNDEDYRALFAGTPFATAPRSMQGEVVRRAQTLLAGRGFYRDPIDGEPGPATEEALLSYQRRARLPLSGALDLQTLSSLRLLPNRSTSSSQQGRYRAPETETRAVIRGIWIE